MVHSIFPASGNKLLDIRLQNGDLYVLDTMLVLICSFSSFIGVTLTRKFEKAEADEDEAEAILVKAMAGSLDFRNREYE